MRLLTCVLYSALVPENCISEAPGTTAKLKDCQPKEAHFKKAKDQQVVLSCCAGFGYFLFLMPQYLPYDQDFT